MSLFLTIDPGPAQSAYLLFDSCAAAYPLVALRAGIESNEALRLGLVCDKLLCVADLLVVEEVVSYGMAVGREVFETVFWSGRFVEAWGGLYRMMPRTEVKVHLCRSAKATDATIRQALLDLYGGQKQALGVHNKKRQAPGPLYGITKDVWSCLALAVTYQAHYETHNGIMPCQRCGWKEEDHDASKSRV